MYATSSRSTRPSSSRVEAAIATVAPNAQSRLAAWTSRLLRIATASSRVMSLDEFNFDRACPAGSITRHHPERSKPAPGKGHCGRAATPSTTANQLVFCHVSIRLPSIRRGGSKSGCRDSDGRGGVKGWCGMVGAVGVRCWAADVHSLFFVCRSFASDFTPRISMTRSSASGSTWTSRVANWGCGVA